MSSTDSVKRPANTDKPETGNVKKSRGDNGDSVTGDEQLPDMVHSINRWEEADLGNEKRNEKFLRLMGGAKKEHTGRFVCGNDEPGDELGSSSSTMTTTTTMTAPRKAKANLEAKLETQYNESMESAMRQRGGRHRGLGYHGASEADLLAPPPPDDPSLPMPVPDHDAPEPETELPPVVESGMVDQQDEDDQSDEQDDEEEEDDDDGGGESKESENDSDSP